MPGVTYFFVSAQEAGQKLFQLLNRHLDGQVPRSALMRWIRTGQVRIDGRRSAPFVRVKKGQRIRVPPYELCSGRVGKNGAGGINKVFEDEQILVIAKPGHLASQPGSKVTDSVYARIKQAYHGTDWVPALVHRLDKDTSGLLVLAKSYNYLQYLQGLWLKHQVSKVYLAWVAGETSWKKWQKIEDFFQQQRPGRALKIQQAVSWVKTIGNKELEARKGWASLVAVRLETGRKHQIRSQLARRGSPVVGDRKFKGLDWGELLLHATYLAWDNYEFFLPPKWQGEFFLSSRLVQSCLMSFRNLI